MCPCYAQKGGERECENALVALLDFDKFELVKELLRNRPKIVWCTRLQRAQGDEERARIEVRLIRPTLPMSGRVFRYLIRLPPIFGHVLLCASALHPSPLPSALEGAEISSSCVILCSLLVSSVAGGCLECWD